jgi:hypothetical protein
LPGPHGAVWPSFQQDVTEADAAARPPARSTEWSIIAVRCSVDCVSFFE